MSPARPPEEARCAGEAERTPASAAAARARALPPHDRLVAITGSTGFIGRHLVVALAQAGWRVRLLLRRDPDEPTWVPKSSPARSATAQRSTGSCKARAPSFISPG